MPDIARSSTRSDSAKDTCRVLSIYLFRLQCKIAYLYIQRRIRVFSLGLRSNVVVILIPCRSVIFVVGHVRRVLDDEILLDMRCSCFDGGRSRKRGDLLWDSRSRDGCGGKRAPIRAPIHTATRFPRHDFTTLFCIQHQ